MVCILELKDYSNLAEVLVEKSQKMGAEDTEIYIINSHDLMIDISQGKIETLKTADNCGVGSRVLKNKRIGYSFSSDFSDQAFQKMLDNAVNNSLQATYDEANFFPHYSGDYPKLNLYNQNIIDVSLEEKINIAREIDHYAKNYDKRIKVTESCTYQDMVYNVVLLNSKGVGGSYQGTYSGIHCFVVAEENNENQTGFAMQFDLDLITLDPKRIGEEAAEKAVKMLGAKTVKTQKTDLILDPFVSVNFLSVLAPSLSAEAVQKGKSMFINKLGTQIASEQMTIVDDGKKPGGLLSAPFDGEGVATQTTPVIVEGELQNFLHNTYTSHKEGVKTTSNSSRSSYKAIPEIGTTNFYIKKGNHKRDKLIKDLETGFYVTEVMGIHTADPITGDFSVGASGIWIEKGEFAFPVRGVTIAGNLIELLHSVDSVADDLTFYIGKGSPTIKISSVTVSGD